MLKRALRPEICQILGRCLFILLLLAQGVRAEVNRAPANYVPDDDVIVVPIYYEDNIFVKMKEDNSTHIKSTRNQLRSWQAREEFENAWGLEGRGIYNYPDQEARLDFFKRTYLRYLTKRAERSVRDDVKEGIQGAWRSWTAKDEVKTIKANQENSDFIAKNKSSKLSKNLTVDKNIKTSKKSKLKFRFQPRIEQGLVKMSVRNDYIKATAWLGINNTQELRLEHNSPEIGFSALANYYVHKNELLLSLNQRLFSHISAHYTYREQVLEDSLNPQNKDVETIFELRYGITF